MEAWAWNTRPGYRGEGCVEHVEDLGRSGGCIHQAAVSADFKTPPARAAARRYRRADARSRCRDQLLDRAPQGRLEVDQTSPTWGSRHPDHGSRRAKRTSAPIRPVLVRHIVGRRSSRVTRPGCHRRRPASTTANEQDLGGCTSVSIVRANSGFVPQGRELRGVLRSAT